MGARQAAEHSAAPAWGGHSSSVGQFPRTSLCDILEANQLQQQGTSSRAPWADLVRQDNQQQRSAEPHLTDFGMLEQQPVADKHPNKPIDPLLAEAQKSKPDGLKGQIRCLACGKVCGDHRSLAQHLKDKHRGINAPDAPSGTGQGGSSARSGLTLGDIMVIRPKKAAPKPQLGGSSGGISLTAKQLRNVRGLAKAYPTRDELARVIKGKLGSSSSKKKLSRLKNVILRERTEKAAVAATQAAEVAKAVAKKAGQAKQQVVESLHAAEARLKIGRNAGTRPEPSLITEIQVLEMAMAEADRRLQEALRKAEEANAELQKAKEERDKAWKVPAADKEEESEHQEETKAADVVSPHDAPSASEPPPAALVSAVDAKAAAGDSKGKRAGEEDRAHRRLHAHGERVAVDLGIQEEEDAESLHGLQGFENVLASWVHDANERGLDAMARAAADPAKGDDGSALLHRSLDDEGTDSESDSDGIGPDGWDDVLSAWMNNAGVLSQQRTASPQPPSSETQPAGEFSPRPPLPIFQALPTSPRPATLATDAITSPRTMTSSGSPHSSGATTPHAGIPKAGANLPTVAEDVMSPPTTTASPHSSGRNTPFSYLRYMSEGYSSPGISTISRQGSLAREGYPSPGTSANGSREGSLGRDFLSEGFMSTGNTVASQRMGLLSREGSLGREVFSEGNLSPGANAGVAQKMGLSREGSWGRDGFGEGYLSPRANPSNGHLMGLSRHSSIDTRGWMNDRALAAREPMPLLADVLAGRGLSHDALLDLRVGLEDSASVRSEDGRATPIFTGHMAGAGRSVSQRFPMRHSDGGAPLLGSPSPSQHRASWEPWRGRSEHGMRWQDSLGNNPPMLPRLHSTGHCLPVPPAFRGGGGGAVRLGLGAAEREATPIDLFSRAASVGAMAELGLSRHTEVDLTQVPKLNLNVLTAEQQCMLDGLPALPSPQVRPGEPPLARLPSITRPNSATPPTPSPGLRSVNSGLGSLAKSAGVGSGSVPAWLATVSSDDEAEQQEASQVPPGLALNGQSASQPRRAASLPSSQQEAFQQLTRNAHHGSPQTHSHCAPQSPLPHLFHQSGGIQQQRPDYHQHPAQTPSHPIDFHPGFGMPAPGWQNPNPFQDAAEMYPDLSGAFSGLPHNMHPPQNTALRHLGMFSNGLGQGFGADMGAPMDPGLLGMLPPQDPHVFGGQMGMSGGDGGGFESLLQAQGLHHAMFGEVGDAGGGGDGLRNGLGPQMSHSGGPAFYEYRCEVCRVTCCGASNFEQHCVSKKHLRKAAVAGAAAVADSPPSGEGEEGGDEAAEGTLAANPTYVGLQAHCRTYCKQVISTDLNRVVVELLQHLLFWQERSKSVNPHSAAKKKRLVSGLREVAKAIKLGKAKTVIVTPNIEHIETEGGLDDLLSSILEQAQQSNTPIVFALSRKKLGQVFGCRKKMSAIAILDYSGAEGLFKEMGQLAAQGRSDWLEHNPDDAAEPEEGPTGESANSSTAEVIYRLRSDGRRVPVTDSSAAAAIEERAAQHVRATSTAQQRSEGEHAGQKRLPGSNGLHAEGSAAPPSLQISAAQREGSATDLVEASARAGSAAEGSPTSKKEHEIERAADSAMAAHVQGHETATSSLGKLSLGRASALTPASSIPRDSAAVELQQSAAGLSHGQEQSCPERAGSATASARSPESHPHSQLLPEASPSQADPDRGQQGSSNPATWAVPQGATHQQNGQGTMRGGLPKGSQESYGISPRLGGVHNTPQGAMNGAMDARRDSSGRILNVRAPKFVPRGGMW